MAHLIFIAKDRPPAVHALEGAVRIGRSLDCDIFIPDIFVSREHCRIEKSPAGWRVTDARSRNGIFFNGKRIFRRQLQPGDVIELGTVAFQFADGEDALPGGATTNPAPYGSGRAFTELMDTLFAEGLRVSDYALLKRRDPMWVAARAEAARTEVTAEAEPEAAPEYFEEWTELDLELGGIREPVTAAFVLVPAESAAAATAAEAAREAEAAGESVFALDAPDDATNAPVAPVAGPQRGWGKQPLWDEKDFAQEKDPARRTRVARTPAPAPAAGSGSRPGAAGPRLAARPAGTGPRVLSGPTLGDRLRDAYEVLRSANLSELVEQAVARPLLSGSAAAGFLALLITWYWWSNRVVYHLPKDYALRRASYVNAQGD